MSNELKFLVYCIEEYKFAKNLTGKETVTLFDRYQVSDYITSCYESLHTTGVNYIIDDIDSFIIDTIDLENRQL